jgi:hypothetical protein
MEKDIKNLISKDNLQSAAMVGLLITSFQILVSLIGQIIGSKKIS